MHVSLIIDSFHQAVVKVARPDGIAHYTDDLLTIDEAAAFAISNGATASDVHQIMAAGALAVHFNTQDRTPSNLLQIAPLLGFDVVNYAIAS